MSAPISRSKILAVSGHSASHPPVRRDLPKGRTDMSGRGNGQYDDRIRARAMVVDRQPSNRPIGHADRRLDFRGGGIQAVADAERLGFLGGCDIFEPTRPGGVAGQSPNGKCRLKAGDDVGPAIEGFGTQKQICIDA